MFRFTIRDVLWLMVVVALACGWWVSLSRSKEELRDARSWFDKACYKLAEQRREIESLKNGDTLSP
jgi:hypothetical protein